MTPDDFPREARSLLARPRYCDLAVNYRPGLEAARDWSVPRLMYLDFRDRMGRKGGQALSDESFHEFIAETARRYRDGVETIMRRDLAEALPADDVTRALDELIDSGVMIREQGTLPQYRVEPQRLAYGLGLLLAEELAQESRKPFEDLFDHLGRWLEVHPDTDLVAEILSAAVLFSASRPDCPQRVTAALLARWVALRSFDHRGRDDVGVYLVDCPGAYVEASERIFASGDAGLAARARLTRAFCSRRDNPSVRETIVSACERWMGFVHPLGRRGRGINDAREREDWRSRIASSLVEVNGPESSRYGGDLIGIDEEGLASLSDLAIDIAMAGPRRPFARTFLRWAVARSVADDGSGSDRVAWALRLTDEELWSSVAVDAEQLAQSGNRLLQRAAHVLLTCLGTHEAHRRRDLLPAGLFPRHPILQAHDRDPCGSGSAWLREHCAPCMEREDLKIQVLAQGLGEHALDPSLVASDSFVKRLPNALDDVDPANVSSSRSQSSDDLDLKWRELALAAFAPTSLAKFMRSVVHTASGRDEADLCCLGWLLSSLTLLLGPAERVALESAWERLEAVIGAGRGERTDAEWDQVRHGEAFLFGALLYLWEPEERVRRFLKRPQGALFSENWFSVLGTPAADVPEVLLPESADADPDAVVRRLVVLCAHPPPVDDVTRARLMAYLHSDNASVRTLALHVVHESQDQALIRAVLDGGYKFGAAAGDEECQWGAMILGEHGRDRPFEDLAARIRPEHLGYLVAMRGFRLEEIDALADRLGSRPDPDLARGLGREVTMAIVQRRPALADVWASIPDEDDAYAFSLVFSGGEFMPIVSSALLGTKPARGAQLWRALTNPKARVRSDGLWVPFSPPECREVLELREECLARCRNDEDISSLSRHTTGWGCGDWLAQTIRRLAGSRILWHRALGLALLGFSDVDEKSFRELRDEAMPEGSWLERVARNAELHWKQNQWARHWFTKFLSETSDEVAWSRYRLFRRCVDGRFHLWKDEFMEAATAAPDALRRRRAFLDANRGNLDQEISKRDHGRRGQLFTLQANDRDLPDNWSPSTAVRTLGG